MSLLQSDHLFTDDVERKLPIVYILSGGSIRIIAQFLKRENNITGTSTEIIELLEQRFSYTGGIKDILLNNIVPLDSREEMVSKNNKMYATFNKLFNDHFWELFFDENIKEFIHKTTIPEIAYCKNKESNKLWNLSLNSDLHHTYAEQIRTKLNEFYLGENTELTRKQAEGLRVALFNYSQFYKGNCSLGKEAEEFLWKQQTISIKGKVIPGTVILSKLGYRKKGIIQGVGGLGVLDYSNDSDRGLDTFNEHDALYLESVYEMMNNLNNSLRDPLINLTNRNHAYFSFIVDEVQKQVENVLGNRFRLFTHFPQSKSEQSRDNTHKKRFMNYLENPNFDPSLHGAEVNKHMFHKYIGYRKVYSKEEGMITMEQFIQSYVDLIVQLSVLVSRHWVNYSHTVESHTTPHEQLERVLENHFPFVAREVLLNSMY